MALRLATRGSALALTQARWVAERLGGAELVEARTDYRGPGDKSRFVRGVEAAVLAGDAEVGVHSAKDLPGAAEMAAGLEIAAAPVREDPLDAWIGVGSSLDEFEKVFLANLTCRLILFRFKDRKKDPRAVDELASAEFRPTFGKTETVRVNRFLGSKIPGANFPIGNGLGVAVVIEKKTVGQLTLAKDVSHRAALRIESVSLDFSPRNRDENVVA